MTLSSDIIAQAFREGNLVAVGAQPTTEEQTEGLDRLNNFVSALFGFNLGVYLQDWSVPPSTTAPIYARYPLLPADEALPPEVWPYPPSNVRLLSRLSTATTVYLQARPEDGARIAFRDIGATATLTLDANGRLIEGALTKDLVAGASGAEWFYRADLGDWRLLGTLALTDSSPLPPEFDDLLITGLSIRLSARYGNEPSSGTALVFKDMLDKLRTRYAQALREPAPADISPRYMDEYHHYGGFS